MKDVLNSKIVTSYLTRTLIIGMFLVNNSLFAQDDINKGIEIFEKQNYYGAQKYFIDFLKNNPDDPTAYYYLGRISFAMDDFEVASDHFDKATDLDDSNTDFFTWKGITYIELLSRVDFMKQGLYAPRALNALEKAVDLDPENVDARLWLAGYYAQAPSFAGGSKDGARKEFETIIEIDPAFIPVYTQKAIFLIGVEEYDEAFTTLEKAISLNPDDFESYFFMGVLSAKSGKYDTQGIMSLKKFIEQVPENQNESIDEAWWYLGTIYNNEGNINEAKKAYEQAISINPEKEDYKKSLKRIM